MSVPLRRVRGCLRCALGLPAGLLYVPPVSTPRPLNESVGLFLAAALLAVADSGCSQGGFVATPGADGSLPPPAADLAMADLAPAPDLVRRMPSASVSFGAPTTYAAPQPAYHLAVGRIDLDELDDVVVSGQPGVSVYLSRGDGTLTPKPQSAPANWQVAIADMNRDGKGDLLLTDTGNGAISISLGNGDGSFGSPSRVMTGGAPQGVAAADLNSDGSPDLLAVDQTGAQLVSFLGRGDGTVSMAQKLPTGMAPLWVTTGDLDGDRRSDAIAVNLSSASFTVFLGKGDGTFQPGREVKTIASPVTAALADLDLDGDLDVALNGEGVEQAVAVHLGDGKGGFAPKVTYPESQTSGQGIAIADVNGDGWPDLLAAAAFSAPARVFLGAGNGAFLAEKTFKGSGNNVFNLCAVDLNRDGLPDLVLGDGSERKISVLLNTTPR